MTRSLLDILRYMSVLHIGGQHKCKNWKENGTQCVVVLL